MAPPRLLVVGAGGIGGIVAAHLLARGHDVTTLSSNQAIAEALACRGFSVSGASRIEGVRGPVVTDPAELTGSFDFVLLAVPPVEIERAAARVAPFVAPGGAFVCLANGLPEERVARVVGTDRVLGAVVKWGASQREPGRYERTSLGGFVVGRLLGPVDDRVRVLGDALACIGPVEQTDRLRGARWSKLAVNAAISSLGTVGGARLGELLRHSFVRRLAMDVFGEALAVAHAEGVELEPVLGPMRLELLAVDPRADAVPSVASLAVKHAFLLVIGARYRRLRSSMLAAIERGREPGVEFLNGEIHRRAEPHGLCCPVNAALEERVLAIAAGRAKSSLETLGEVFESTRRPPQ